MKKLIFIVLLVAAVGGAAVTCPSEQAHKNALQEKLQSTLTEQTSGKGGKLLGTLGSVLGSSVIDFAFDQAVEYKNYVVFSQCKIQGKTVSWGLYGHVFFVDEKGLSQVGVE